MNSYILIRRLRGPAFLLLVGIIALLAQADILSWGKSWPLFLILAGVLLLAERAALAAEGGYPPPAAPYPYPGAVNPNPAGAQQPPAQPGAAIVPAHTDDFGDQQGGGQS